MSWKAEIEELARRRELAAAMGGPEGVARQHERGKLTVRERIERLADAGTFREFGGLRGEGVYDRSGEQLVSLHAQGPGRRHVPHRRPQGDPDRRRLHGPRRLGGRASTAGWARSWPPTSGPSPGGCRYIRLLDAAGGSVRGFEELGRTYLPDGNIWSTIDVTLLGEVPVVSAVLGSVAGLPAVNACMAHFNVMLARHGPGLPGRSAGGEGRARLRHHQGGAGRLRGPHPPERRRSTTSRSTRTTPWRRSGGSSPTCPPTCTSRRPGSRGPARTARRPPTTTGRS